MISYLNYTNSKYIFVKLHKLDSLLLLIKRKMCILYKNHLTNRNCFLIMKEKEIHISRRMRNGAVEQMTDKEVRKLKRADLLEILFYLQKENETLRQENESLRQQMETVISARNLSDEDLERIRSAVKEAVSQAAAAGK